MSSTNTQQAWIERLQTYNEDAVIFEQLTIAGVADKGSKIVAAYDYSQCITDLMAANGFGYDDAREWLESQIISQCSSEDHPVFICRDLAGF